MLMVEGGSAPRVIASRSRPRAATEDQEFECAQGQDVCVARWTACAGRTRGPERGGPTRSHPEPDRDPSQRRRVLGERFPGRRGRRGSSRRKPNPTKATHMSTRGGAVAARWAHNPKVGGSNPSPATTIFTVVHDSFGCVRTSRLRLTCSSKERQLGCRLLLLSLL